MFFTSDKLERQVPAFFPADFDATDWQLVSAAFDEMLTQPIATPMDLITLLYKASELMQLVLEKYKDTFIRTLADTTDEIAKASHAILLQDIILPSYDRCREVLRLYYEHPYRLLLNQDNYIQINKLAEQELKQDNPVSPETALQQTQLEQSYHQAINLLSLRYQGTAYPIKAVSELLPKVAPEQREILWKARSAALTDHKDELAGIMHQLIQVRHAEATEAGFKSYLEYALSTGIYPVTDISRLSAIHTAIHKTVLPEVKKIIKQRRQNLKLKSIRTWDIESEPQLSGLHPFTTTDELIEKAISVLYDIRFEYGILLNKMHNTGFLDLDYRPEKVPGEYYVACPAYGGGHILMNCTGKHRDMIMLFHEMGHILQASSQAKHLMGELTPQPVQILELASQSLVYLSTGYWDTFYPDKKDRETALRSLYEQDLIQLLRWSILNSFELAIYANPDWTPAQREKAMLDICCQYDWGMDSSGLDSWQSTHWMLENTLFDKPFYSFFSALAILDVWQIFRNYHRNPVDTMTRFQLFIERSIELSTADIYKELDIKQDYSEHHIRKLMDYMAVEIRKAKH